MLKAIQYCRIKGIKFRYSDYFSNMPKAGSQGFGGYMTVQGDVIINGQRLNITMVIPLMEANQVFDPIFKEGKAVESYGTCTLHYGCTQGNFIFGEGNSRNNVTEMYVSGSYYSFMYDFFTGAPRRTGPEGGGRDPGGRNQNNVNQPEPFEQGSPVVAEDI